MADDAKMTDAVPKALTADTATPMNVPAKTELSPAAKLLADVVAAVKMVPKAVATKEARFVSRALRQGSALRKKLNAQVLRTVVNRIPAEHAARQLLLSTIPEPMETENVPTAEVAAEKCEEAIEFIEMLAVLFLIDTDARAAALQVARDIASRLSTVDTAADALAARCWFYYSRAAELNNCLPAIRSELMAAHRTATLRRLDETKATLLNALLRGLIAQNLIDQADKLQSAAPTAEGSASAPQYARFLYYTGRVRLVQRDYAGALACLQQALRKAPQRASARGFHVAVTKLLVTVQLLTADIPERATFSQKGMRHALAPYLRLAQAVRVGDLAAFRAAVEAHRGAFLRDGTLSLIARLRHNVIKAGLRKISLSYSRISLEDVARKLQLGSSADCEFVVAKAIRDGVISAVIDHERGCVQSKETLDVYATQQPHAAFHQRITDCLALHNEAIRAMRFSEDAHKPKPLQENAEDRIDEEEAMAAEAGDDGGMDDF